MRKIIQVVRGNDTIYALCDDGSLWFRDFGKTGTVWVKMDGIPQ